jgi:hypothetical protein
MASARASCAPAYGSSLAKRPLQSVARATPRTGLVVDADHAGVLRLREDGVAEDVAVVLVGESTTGRTGSGSRRAGAGWREVVVGDRAGQLLGEVRLQVVLPVGAREGPLVRRALVRHRAGRDVDDDLAVPLDDEVVAVGDLADDGRVDLPLHADLEEAADLVRLDDGHHPLL